MTQKNPQKLSSLTALVIIQILNMTKALGPHWECSCVYSEHMTKSLIKPTIQNRNPLTEVTCVHNFGLFLIGKYSEWKKQTNPPCNLSTSICLWC